MKVVLYVLLNLHVEPLAAKEAALAGFGGGASNWRRIAMATVLFGYMAKYLLYVGSAASPAGLAAFLACHLSTHTP